MGSKARHAKEILKAVNEELVACNYKSNVWVEPFVGGANMIEHVKESKTRIGNDSHFYLVEMLKSVRDGWIPPEYVSEDEYKNARLNKESLPAYLVGFIGFGCSYSGKWFGGFARNISKDAPDAELLNKTKRNYCAESKRNILKQVQRIKGVDFRNSNYEDLEIPNQSVIYCDPPYAGTTKYKDRFDNDRFWQWCDKQFQNGHKVFVSEYVAPEGWKCIWQKEVNNSLTKNTGGKKGVERLFTK